MSHEIDFNAIADIGLMPIHAVRFLYKTSGIDEDEEPITIDNFINIWHLESDSNFKITSITRETDVGTVVTLGYNFEVNLSIPQNDYYSGGQLFMWMKLLSLGNINMNLYLGNVKIDTETGNSMQTLNSTNGMMINFGGYEIASFNYDVESVEYRPHISAHIKGFKKYL